ncbi:hypothetical protein PHYBLDRAFT_62054 [Phycomyces blakesleeanus NRRL 1555(-)]|uniref:Uncharacterized protein n=1 Tax=Phycomyces blakesleeanus (strain ATCC 8743b / DSM 1359 / FGSC 10004 / NBRC 33097 / NRRL 1555) TaxID=763407 RepID=A0A163BE75_PHYB8|nr:hypothetical protein PHYBLDRAFT_62054 [Phycomyces blakesleeanus NRRL 1555(-)]OAD81011.1 hypothetical protein PHYBLDRAFT_62054 [Phycomyces blakesleeanus NRRL 1555(-)]|eukprot:XP_018299051.1 hypothetical protein PHYBLDRAFT_62054 [Phycomyces blakesleeanus NRRL 1555(-)]
MLWLCLKQSNVVFIRIPRFYVSKKNRVLTNQNTSKSGLYSESHHSIPYKIDAISLNLDIKRKCEKMLWLRLKQSNVVFIRIPRFYVSKKNRVLTNQNTSKSGLYSESHHSIPYKIDAISLNLDIKRKCEKMLWLRLKQSNVVFIRIPRFYVSKKNRVLTNQNTSKSGLYSESHHSIPYKIDAISLNLDIKRKCEKMLWLRLKQSNVVFIRIPRFYASKKNRVLTKFINSSQNRCRFCAPDVTQRSISGRLQGIFGTQTV